jgi:two-component system, OmpR family, response regulator
LATVATVRRLSRTRSHAMTETPNILVVDDDREIRSLLRDYLEKSGFRATAVSDGLETRRALGSQRFDLIVLDVMLPGESGLEICRELRETSYIPIVMLTALGEEVDRVVGLEVGADDYVAKPFSPRELVGRIRAVLRRVHQAAQFVEPYDAHARYTFAQWRLDTAARTLMSPLGDVVMLGGAEFEVLALLLSRAPHLVTRPQLIEFVRGRDFDPFDRSIDVRVSRLRQALGDDARAPRIVKTVYGQGYLVGVPVERDVR